MSAKEVGTVDPADQQQPAVPEVTDITLEAARKQKIHNLKLKTACLSNEEYVQDLHVSTGARRSGRSCRRRTRRRTSCLQQWRVGRSGA
ncbi:hypothetical protein ERJ75_001224000 [Trypanosoma vivax]|nr:hypothetical protein ERJ75_001224000 [Trypanosoma vivax]